MPTVSCICNECGDRFYIKDSYIPVTKNNMRIEKNCKSPKTWDEWIYHTMSFCDKCRLQTTPDSCVKDYQKYTNTSLDN